jgi:hypothetical protein
VGIQTTIPSLATKEELSTEKAALTKLIETNIEAANSMKFIGKISS